MLSWSTTFGEHSTRYRSRTLAPAVPTKSTHSRMPNEEILRTPPRSRMSVSALIVWASFFPSKCSSMVPDRRRQVTGPSVNLSSLSLARGVRAAARWLPSWVGSVEEVKRLGLGLELAQVEVEVEHARHLRPVAGDDVEQERPGGLQARHDAQAGAAAGAIELPGEAAREPPEH